jgi:tetratricopeptide (TPR) repeat protein
MWPDIGVRRARAASAGGRQALAGDDLPAAERQFGAALRRLSRAIGKDERATETAAAATIGLGRVCLARDDLHGADLRFAEVHKLRPAHWEGFFWTGCTAARRGEFARADWYLSAALARDSRQGRAYLQRAYVRLRQHRSEAALADLYAADHRQALDDRGRVLLAGLLLHRSRWAQAEEYVNSVSPAGRTPQAAALLGFALHRQGKLVAAHEAYQFALAGGYTEDTVLHQHGLVGYQLGRFISSVESWSTLTARYPERPEFATLRATACYAYARQLVEQREFALAARYLETAAVPGELNSTIAELHLQAAARIIDSTASGPLLAHLTRSRQLCAADPRPAHYLAVVAALTGRFDEAADLWRELPDGPRSRYGLALCAIGRGEPELALADLLDLASTSTDPLIRTRSAHAVVALSLRAGDWPTALAALEPVAGGDTGNETAWVGLHAEGLYRTGQYDTLLGLAATGPRRPWQDLARLRTAAAAAEPPGEDELEPVGRHRRAGLELALVLRETALAHAERGDWVPAATWLLRAERLDPTARPDATAQLRAPEERAPKLIDALVHGLGGHRRLAVERLAAASRRDPANRGLSHTRALMLLHTVTARELPPDEPEGWLACIGAWMSVLYDEEFWTGWQRRAEDRYGASVPTPMLDTLRTSLRELIEHRVAADHVNGGPPLTLLLRRENDAARVLRAAGGLPVEDPRHVEARLVCGPLRIIELGLQDQLGRFTVGLGNADARAEDLLRRFSQLGLAEVQLAAGRPAEALELARDLRCPDCRARGPEVPGADQLLVCADDCAYFDQYNPAFTALANKHQELAVGGTTLAVEALLGLAKAAVSEGTPDVDEVARFWRDAVEYAERSGSRTTVRQAVVDTAVGRAEALSHKEDWGRAVALLDLAVELVDPVETHRRDQLVTQLAAMLTTRGITTFNADASTVATACQDLARAVELSPHLLRARRNLGALLRVMALERFDQRDYLGAAPLLREAIEQFEHGLTDKPGDPEFTEWRDRAGADLNVVFRVLAGANHGRRR